MHVAEVLSGVATQAEFEHLKALFEGLDRLADPADLWDRVAESRFALAARVTRPLWSTSRSP